MADFPLLLPQYVEKYNPPKRPTYRFISDSQLSTTVVTSCNPGRFSMNLRWTRLRPGEFGKLIAFTSASEGVGFDYESGLSLESFNIPRSHPIWTSVPNWREIEQYWLTTGSIDTALWQIVSSSEPDMQNKNILTWEMRVEEVPARRAIA